MMLKEKIIFLPLVAVFIVIVFFGFASQGKKKEATEDLLKEIEIATKNSRAQKKAAVDKWNFDNIILEDKIETYKSLTKRSPFFRFAEDKPNVKKDEPIVVEKKEPKKAILKYKGKVMMGSKVMVVIEDQGTGKSFFVQEGDMVGDFLVVRIDEKEVELKKKGGEQLVLSVVKKRPDTEQEK